MFRLKLDENVFIFWCDIVQWYCINEIYIYIHIENACYKSRSYVKHYQDVVQHVKHWTDAYHSAKSYLDFVSRHFGKGIEDLRQHVKRNGTEKNIFYSVFNQISDSKKIIYNESQCFWWWWWWWIVFVVWLTDERRLALFPAGTIVRDSHHLESPTRREQDLNLHRTRVQALLNEAVQ